MELRLEVPDDLLRTHDQPPLDQNREAKLLLLLELYREGRLSLGKFSELSELPQAALLETLRDHETYLNYSPDDLVRDRQTLQ